LSESACNGKFVGSQALEIYFIWLQSQFH